MNAAHLRILLLALIAGLLGLAAGRWWFAPAPATPARPALSLGEQAPDLSYRDVNGRNHALSEHAGAPLLINFWATWCAPCIEELPRLADLHRRRHNDGLAVLAIALDESEAVRAFLDQHGLADLPTGMDRAAGNDASVQLGNARGVLPFSVLLDGKRRLLRQQAGALDAAQLAEWAAQARAD